MSSFTATFAVHPLTCSSCIPPLETTLLALPGLFSVSIDLPTQNLTTTGTTPPSTIVKAIQSLGKDAILRGSGTGSGTGTGSGGAAVCILETGRGGKVQGLARMVQVAGLTEGDGAGGKARTLVDLTLKGLGRGEAEGVYQVTIRQKGDISRGAASMGGVWDSTDQNGIPPEKWRGYLGSVQVDNKGIGSAFLDSAFAVSGVIGRGMVVSRVGIQIEGEAFGHDEEDTLVGVIARSAGLWENEKTVCSCSGKKVWEEREEQVAKGMV